MSKSPLKFWQENEPGRFRGEHPLVVNAKDGSVLAYVSAGEFEMGSAQGQGYDNEHPKHRVELSAYWIGVYAVTNAQYMKFIEANGHRVPDHADWGTPIWKGRGFPVEKADHPVVCVSWDDAQAYAEWAGCEFASEAQWEKACRGALGLEYPWGNEWDEKRCRNYKNKGNETTCRVYEYAEGVSGYGIYNQSGNVWVWCADWYDEHYYRQSPKKNPNGPAAGSHRVCRGGGWGGGPGRFRAARRDWDEAGTRGYQGFRLVRSAS